jgi:hypothetical protein
MLMSWLRAPPSDQLSNRYGTPSLVKLAGAEIVVWKPIAACALCGVVTDVPA